jgi:hypothetical protein
MRITFSVAECVLVLLAAIFLIRFGSLTRRAHRPVVRIGVSLPFRTDASDALPMYDAIKKAFRTFGPGVRNVDDRTLEIHGQGIELVPFDDSTIGDTDCRGPRSCHIAFLSSDDRHLGPGKPFSRLTNDPQVAAVIGPFNSGVAVSEIPATNADHIPLVSPSNAADCLTNPRYADGSCDARRWEDSAYFRVATPDSVPQKALADYLWSAWKEQHPATTPRVVVFKESGPRAEPFSDGGAQRFSEAWLQHAGVVAPAVYPLAVASTDDDLRASLSRLTFVPDIVVYAGTRDVGARLYRELAPAGLPQAIFASAPSRASSTTSGIRSSTISRSARRPRRQAAPPRAGTLVPQAGHIEDPMAEHGRSPQHRVPRRDRHLLLRRQRRRRCGRRHDLGLRQSRPGTEMEGREDQHPPAGQLKPPAPSRRGRLVGHAVTRWPRPSSPLGAFRPSETGWQWNPPLDSVWGRAALLPLEPV